MDWLTSPEAWIALATLTALEMVLGIDNIVFITILVGRVEKEKRKQARTLGLALAMITRILLLLTLAWVMKLNKPLFSLFSNAISGRDLILIVGGLFLLGKSTHEIHENLEPEKAHEAQNSSRISYTGVLLQIALIDIIFSLDSVITAVGMAKHLPVMILAIVISMCVMMVAAGTIGEYIDRHPTLKMLALSFLILVGVTLLGEGLDLHIPKGYVYFAMAFSIGVEMLNLRLRSRLIPVLSSSDAIESGTTKTKGSE